MSSRGSRARSHASGASSRLCLYEEFGGKEGLFREALDAYLQSLEVVVGHLDREPKGLANIERFWPAVVDFPFLHGCFALNTIREKHVVGRKAFRKVTGLVRRVESGFEANLRAARARGEIPVDRDVEGLARFLTALDIGTLSYGSLVAKAGESRAQILAMAKAAVL
jgi:AcrR family transcriptional regulator